MSIENNYQLLIEKLDRFIRKYYINQLIRGLLYSVGFVLLLFLVAAFLEDQFYFGTGGRKVLFYSFLGSSILALGWWVVNPLLKYFSLGHRISHDQAAQIIGSHFSGVQDKLTNVLQLKRNADLSSDDSKELILASINQKSDEIKLVPFRSAIDLSKNKKYLKYSLPPLMLLLVLLFAAPSMIKDSTHRLLHSNQEFERAAPFHFSLVNEDLSVVQYEDFELQVEVGGELLPNDVFIQIEDYVYRLQKEDPTTFKYIFNNVQKNTEFNLFSGDINSKDFEINVIRKPVITDFNIAIDYPAYTRRQDEILNNIGDLVVPVGSKVSWDVKTENTESIQIQFSADPDKTTLDQKTESLFNHSARLYKTGYYKIFVSNSELPTADSVQYSIQVIPDQYPSIDVEKFVDSTDSNLLYFLGNVSDDYGLKAITFNYTITSEKGKASELQSTPILEPKSASASYQHTLDLSSLQLSAGDQLTYYFEVFDNDAINGSKSSKTRMFEINKATKQELEENASQNNESIKDNLKKSLEESRKLQEEVKKLKEKLLQKKEMGWEEKKELEKLLERQKELEKQIQEAKEKFQENKENQSEFSQPSEEVLQKQEQLEKMFEELMSEEMKSLMEEIQNLLQELQKDDALEMMQQFEFKDNELEMELDRMLEVFKHLEIEQQMQQQIDKLEELAEKQEELSKDTEKTKTEDSEAGEEENKEDASEEETSEEENNEGENAEKENQEQKEEESQENKGQEQNKENQQSDQNEQKESNASEQEEAEGEKTPQEELLERQEEINESFEEIQESLEELEEKNQELERPKNMDTNESDQQDIQENLDKSSEQLQQQQNSKASKSQKNAAQQMKQMAQKMSSQMQSGQMEQMQEDMAALRQLLENLIAMSFDQEDLFKNISRTSINTPRYIELVQHQHKLKGDFNLIQDSLQALSKRVMQIESYVTEKVAAVNENMQIGLDRLEDRQVTQATDNQQRIMKNVNDLALMLNEAMEQMQQQMSGMMSGTQMCNNPNPGASPADKMTKASEQMGKQMQQMRDALKDGKPVSSEQFAKMAAKQAALRKMLREIQEEQSEKGKGSKELEELQNDLNKIEIDLVNKQLTNEMLKRQKDIQTRLLEAERSERQRGEEEKRKAEVGENKKRELPPSLQEYIKKREAEIENYKLVSPDVKPYYKQLIDEYLRSLNHNN